MQIQKLRLCWIWKKPVETGSFLPHHPFPPLLPRWLSTWKCRCLWRWPPLLPWKMLPAQTPVISQLHLPTPILSPLGSLTSPVFLELECVASSMELPWLQIIPQSALSLRSGSTTLSQKWLKMRKTLIEVPVSCVWPSRISNACALDLSKMTMQYFSCNSYLE